MKNIFNSVLIKDVNRNAFDLSHEVKLTTEFNNLVPFLSQEVYPNETWQVTSEIFARFAPLKAPIMAHVDIKAFFFFVPWRLCWDGWRRFITDGSNGHPKDVTPPALPTISFYHMAGDSGQDSSDSAIAKKVYENVAKYWVNGSLSDYLGFPTLNLKVPVKATEHRQPSHYLGTEERDVIVGKFLETDIDFPLMPFFAYQLVYDEYFRNPNIQESVLLPWCNKYGDSPTLRDANNFDDSLSENVWELLKIRKINWASDYFTTALPYLQRGEPVDIPMVDSKLKFKSEAPTVFRNVNTGDYITNSGNLLVDNSVSAVGNQLVAIDNSKNYEIDTTPGNINDLRRAFTLQKWREKIARVGTRYIEQIKAHFSQTSSDARLQRPEFLGGGITPVIISDTEQTSSGYSQVDLGNGKSSDFISTPQGTLSGQIHSYGRTNKFRKHFEEHGILLGMLAVVPKPEYQNLYNRQWLRREPLDFYFPEFQNLGEQEIKKMELFTEFGKDAKQDNESVFGYQQRFSELRFIPPTCHGDFKDTLGYWTMNRRFDKQPALNSEFLTADANNDIFAYTNDDYHHIWLEIGNNITAVRPLDKYAIPMFS